MIDYRTVGRVNDFPEGTLRAVDVDGWSIAIVNSGGQFYAFSNYCPHLGAELTGSMIEGDEVVCWWHSSVFDMNTGECVGGPASDPLTVYDVRVEGDEVFLGRRRVLES